MKRFLKALLATSFLFFLFPPPGETANPITVYYEGKLLQADALPYIQDDRVMLPLRALGEALEADVHWDADARRVEFYKEANELFLYIDELSYEYNDDILRLDSPPRIKNKRSFVPLRLVSEVFDYTVEWDKVRRAAYIEGKPASQLDPDRPMLALTFDDGPWPGRTERIVEALKAVDGRATFFMVGSSCYAHPEIVEQVAAGGNEIGNHSMHHPNLTQLSWSRLQEELANTDYAILSVTGERPSFIRPTYGAVSQSLQANVDRPLILWNVDSRDWATRSSQATIQHVLSHSHDGAIILMHDIHEATVLAAETLIPELSAQGYQLVTVSELIAMKGIPAGPGALVTHG